MKVLLIYPPYILNIKSVLPDEIEEERGYNPPLGLLYLGGYLQKYSPEIELKMIDGPAQEMTYDKLKKVIKDFAPDVIGVSVMSFAIIDALKVAKITKEINPNTKVVFGGPHVNIYDRETITQGNIDFIVLGEGEKIFNDLLNNIDNEEKLKNIRGLMFLDKHKNIIHTGLPDLIQNLDTIPIPARNLIDNEKYSSILGTNKLVTTMMSSRGCPYRCLFCHRPHLGKVFRAHSADYLIAEIKNCLQYGIKEFLMYDDTFTIKRDRVVKFCDKLIEEKLDITWDIRARVNTVDEELLEKLKKAGCARIHYGVESGTQKILNVLRKGIQTEQVKEVFALTKKVGIETLGYFMIGNPEETREDIETTINFAKNLKADFVHITITMPFPATALYQKALDEGIIKKDVWREFAKHPSRDFMPPVWDKEIPIQELRGYIRKAYRQFYFRPLYLIKRILAVKSWREFTNKARAGLKILKI